MLPVGVSVREDCAIAIVALPKGAETRRTTGTSHAAGGRVAREQKLGERGRVFGPEN
jgi:hypothetical protein